KQNTFELTSPGLFATPGGDVGGGTKVSPGIGSFDVGALSPQIGVGLFRSSVAAVLKALAAKDYAKILAEPNLVVRTGEMGKFFVGTRIPVQQVSGIGAAQTVSITFEEVGIKLNFSPEVLDTGVIRLKIDPAEVSNITRFLTLQGIIAPEIDKRSVSTSVDLKDGESLVLAGLLSEEMKKSIQKLPIFGDIPILGAIFRSTHDELSQKELAFFITPHLVKPAPAGIKTELPQERRLTRGEEKDFDWIPTLPARDSSTEGPARLDEMTMAKPAYAASHNANFDKEVILFVLDYTRAYEDGDIDKFMSFYSLSAVENNRMRYNEIRQTYRKNFENKRYAYTLEDMKLYESGDNVILSGKYGIQEVQGNDRGPIIQGDIRWNLKREKGGLKIIKVDYDRT
ncbi:MAG TPA: type II and III secretion system protein, partial [Thermodesulfovibrionales bacterium]|nr:type II and III secretion system protein [Thermodesulfovibrionales bacterium]